MDRKNRGSEEADKRRIDELRVEVGVKECFKETLVRRRLKRVGHVETMGNEKLAKERNWKEKGGEEDQECDGRMGEILKEWEENGEQQQKIEGLGDC